MWTVSYIVAVSILSDVSVRTLPIYRVPFAICRYNPTCLISQYESINPDALCGCCFFVDLLPSTYSKYDLMPVSVVHYYVCVAHKRIIFRAFLVSFST